MVIYIMNTIYKCLLTSLFYFSYLDFLNLMTYDLRGSADEIASHHSALYSGSYEEGEQKVFNQVKQDHHYR